MKINVVHRNPDDYQVNSFSKNPDIRLHPFEQAREVQRAVVAAKMEKMFSKPLVAVLDGHRDSVCAMTRCRTRENDFFTGACDGEIRHWNLPNQTCSRSILAHNGFIKGLITIHNDQGILSCGTDGLVKLWSVESMKPIDLINLDEIEDVGNLVLLSQTDTSSLQRHINPDSTWNAQSVVNTVDSHYSSSKFATGSDTIEIWDIQKTNPIKSFEWSKSSEAIYVIKFNPYEHNILAGSAMDNTVGLIDIRDKKLALKAKLAMRSNAMCWNPLKPINLTVANEDTNLYTFDVRKFERAMLIHKDFTNAVLDVDYSPLGHEFAASSYDKTIRVFPVQAGRSRDVYHGRRMQVVMTCKYSLNGRFILSGSADFCVRIWKAKAWESLGPKTLREKRAIQYREALKKRHKHVPAARRILNYHHVPKHIKKVTTIRREVHEAELRRALNVELHSKPDSINKKTAKEQIVRRVE